MIKVYLHTNSDPTKRYSQWIFYVWKKITKGKIGPFYKVCLNRAFMQPGCSVLKATKAECCDVPFSAQLLKNVGQTYTVSQHKVKRCKLTVPPV